MIPAPLKAVRAAACEANECARSRGASAAGSRQGGGADKYPLLFYPLEEAV